jgi:histidinol-phosphate phosphatase family protein
LKQAVILAGGQGVRLREVIGTLPKPLVDICGVPLLERQILLAKRHGINEVLILASYGAQQIADLCESKNSWSVNVRLFRDDPPRGTAGATLAVYERLADSFLVMYGDTMLDVDLTRFWSHHNQSHEVAATLLLHPNDHPHDSDLVEVDDNAQILRFHFAPHDPSKVYANLGNAALYCMNKTALAPWKTEPGKLDFGRDLFPRLLKAGKKLFGYRSIEYIKDIGTPSRLSRVRSEFAAGKMSSASLNQPQPIVLLDRDGTINRNVDHLHDLKHMELLPGVSAAIRRLNESNYRCCVVTNQPVIARGQLSIEGLRLIHNKMETLLGCDGAFVDRIYFCPHHPARGFDGERVELKIQCACRKPEQGMINAAIRDLNGDRSVSWIIGDSEIDMETACRGGLRAVRVESIPHEEDKSDTVPHAVVPDLYSAVDFILRIYPRLIALSERIADRVKSRSVVVIDGTTQNSRRMFAKALVESLASRGLVIDLQSLTSRHRRTFSPDSIQLARYDQTGLRFFKSVGDFELNHWRRAQSFQVETDSSVVERNPDVLIVETGSGSPLYPAGEFELHRFFVQGVNRRWLRESHVSKHADVPSEDIQRLPPRGAVFKMQGSGEMVSLTELYN